ncbi:MAG: PAS domain-containing methyl-accepting chemotaxis protein [Gammaproteobacteria bacterium]|nr:PAS domain-containing methyl-accepting chemotaxis protein [Gammaproteobacteria bacterium]
MFGNWGNNETQQKRVSPDYKSKYEALSNQFDALSKSSAIIEFKPDSTIITANENFLNTMGYHLDEIVGKQHKIFCSSDFVNSSDYDNLWTQLRQGNFYSGEVERVTKANEIVWLEASYNPVFDNSGKLVKILKLASDITERTNKAQEQASIMQAMSRSAALIEFNTDSTITDANENFLNLTGYTLEQIKGKKHAIFCEPELVNSTEYKNMWASLNRGEIVSGQFKRIDSSGRTLWLEASYNPIFNIKGKLSTIVKFATDITERVESANQAREIAYSTSLQADQAAREGSEIVEQTINIMTNLSKDITQASEHLDALNKQSDQINNIVATISSIAEQTNLLALNAAIEAARAGEQGRGFAVVADEVRSLAGRTSSSTTEINDVVKHNLALSQQATGTMESSISQVEAGAELVEKLSASISEINAGITQIVDSIDQLNRVN